MSNKKGAPKRSDLLALASSEPVLEEEYHNIFNAMDEALVIYDGETGLVVEANPAACELYECPRADFIGRNPLTFMQPESHAAFQKYLRMSRTGSALERPVLHLRTDGSTFYAEIRRSNVRYQGRDCLLNAIRNVSERMRIEKKLSKEGETSRREQATLLAISHTLASTLELQPGLILDQLRQVIEYEHGGLFALEGTVMVSLALRGTPALENSAPLRIQVNTAGDLTALFNGHRAIRIMDIRSEEPQAQFLRALLADDAAALLDGMKSWMWVPLAVKGRIIGGVGVAQGELNFFTAQHADLALSVADQAAITMINAELYEQAQTLAVLEERQRLARSLHDAVNQSLFSAGLIAEVLPRLWERNQTEARRSLEDLRRLTRGALAEMRALLAELRPSTLTDANLGDLLRLLASAFTGRTNLPVDLKTNGDTSLPAEPQVALYRICQEALNNIGKHAQASQVMIELQHNPTGVQLKICDNGRGFDLEAGPVSGHYGLAMMRERAEAMGAKLTVKSQPGKGTEILVVWDKLEAV